MHVHVSCPEGEAKFWLEPAIVLADHSRLPRRTLSEMKNLVEERKDEIVARWKTHFA